MKTQFLVILFSVFLLFTLEGFAVAQEFENVLEINETISTKREYKSLMKTRNRSEYEVIVRKLDFEEGLGINGYVLFYYYMEDEKLKAIWMQFEEEEIIFDRLYYTWEPTAFIWRFEDSKTGEGFTMSDTTRGKK